MFKYLRFLLGTFIIPFTQSAGAQVPKEQNFKIAAAQISPVFLNKKATVEKVCQTILKAAEDGADLIVFPEAFIPGYPDWTWVIPNSKGAILNELYTELVQNSVTIPDQSTDKMCQAAKKGGINVIVGLNERNTEASNSSLYNSLLFIDDKGKILGKHRKLIPTGGERLIWSQGDGSTLQSFTTPIGKIGGLICWENFMPLARNAMYADGVQIYAAPTWDKSESWLTSMQHIAREGGMYVISCCMALRMDDIPDKYEFKSSYPDGREWINSGNSCIIDPKGRIIAGPVAEKQEIIYADIDLTVITEAKRMFDVTGHYARPDVFKFEVNHTLNKMK